MVLMRTFQRALLSLAIVVLSVANISGYQSASLTPEVATALDRVSPDSLRGNLSFIASDALEGRNTPSRGLDIAAEYIAAQFRRAGLEPVGDDGYFQTANWIVSERDMTGFEFKLSSRTGSVSVDRTQVSMTFTQSVKLTAGTLIKIDSTSIDALVPAQVAGKVVITETNGAALNRIAALNPSVIVLVNRANPIGTGGGGTRLVDPENRPAANPVTAAARITIHAPEAVRFFDALPPGVNAVTLNINVPAYAEHPVKIRNVIGLLRGSDPVLKDSYVFVTAHYDHLGIANGTSGDLIYNGANDDGSGTVSVIEIANALSTLKTRPLRSIVFMTVFGEEKGLLGSRYYGRHPIFPIAKTVADVNLEQVGRTDSTEGPQVNNASMTGFDFSDVGTIFQKAGALTGINVYKHERNSDAYFGRSDNQALADQGVPAHTICVAFDYPDYHSVNDHFEKIDYANMAKVDRMVALGLLMIANNTEEPKWNAANTKTARYIDAWKKQHAN